MSKRKSPPRWKHDRARIGEFIMGCRHMSTATIRFHNAIAGRLGLGPSDHKCAELLLRHGAIPAGELARLSGLSTGAITGVVDRLVAADIVRREADPGDRRRVLLVLEQDCHARMAQLFEGIAAATTALCAEYSPAQLELIQAFMARAVEISDAQAAALQEGTREAPSPRLRRPAKRHLA